MKKAVILFLIELAAVIGSVVSFVWAIVEFIIYLVKDLPFHWRSVYCFIACVVIAVVTVIYSGYLSTKKGAEFKTPYKNNSKFKQRMEEIEVKRLNDRLRKAKKPM